MNYKSILVMAILLIAVKGNGVFAETHSLDFYYEIAKKNCHDISDIRFEMDRINNDILQLLAERTAYVKRAGDIKSQASKIAYDGKRIAEQEQKIIAKSMELELPIEVSLPVFRTIVDESTKFQQEHINQLVLQRQ